jgi:TatD DNase family protein
LRRQPSWCSRIYCRQRCLRLDFPDFADELDAVVARARAAGIARIVTISTRVKRHAEVLGIAERFPDVYCSVGTHPHYAHEELDITVDELIGRTHHPKVVAIGGPEHRRQH